jgi:signal peptidase I
MPKLAYTLSIAIIATLGIIVALLLILPAAGWRIDTVYSGSMEPEIAIGSVVFTRPVPAEAIRPGDIITFKSGNNYFVHRVLEVNEGQPESFVTRGDANEDPDFLPVSYKDVEGKVILSIPYLGYASHAARTAPGIALLFIIPGLLIIWSGMRALLRGQEE